MSDDGAPLYGMDPEALWDDGWEAHRLGRPKDTNPFRTGEAKKLYELSQESLNQPGLAEVPDPTLGREEGSTPGSSFTQVSRDELAEYKRKHGIND